MHPGRPFALLLLAATAAAADDEWTLYELLAPESHRFAITYDVSVTEPGARVFLNPVRSRRPGRLPLREPAQRRAARRAPGAQALSAALE